MASPTQWTWVWVDPGSWWWTEKPGVLRFMGSQRVGHDWATELNWTDSGLRLWVVFLNFIITIISKEQGFLGGYSGKEHSCQCRRHGMWVQSLVGKIPGWMAWQLTPIFLPGESHEQKNLEVCNRGVTKTGTWVKRLSTHSSEELIKATQISLLKTHIFLY